MENDQSNNPAQQMSDFWKMANAGIIYLFDDFYDNAFIVDHANNIAFAKYPGQMEFKVDLTSEKMENVMGPDNLTTKEFYENF